MTALGIVGFGGMGAYHARQLSFMSDVRVVAIVDPNLANQQRARMSYPDDSVRIFGDISQALEEVAVAGWILSSSTATHIPITREILERGGRVLLEKPIANTGAEAASIAPLVSADSDNLMMGHTLLWHRQFQLLQKLLEERGAIKAIHTTRPRSEDHRVRYPGETPFSLTMVHDLYTLFALVKGVQPESFSAQQREHKDGGVDLAHAQMTWASGLFAALRADYLIPDSAASKVSADEIEVSGDDWSIHLPYDKATMRVMSGAGISDVDCPLPAREGVNDFYEDAVRSELEHFIALLHGDTTVPIGARYQDACQIQGWIDRFIALAAGGV